MNRAFAAPPPRQFSIFNFQFSIQAPFGCESIQWRLVETPLRRGSWSQRALKNERSRAVWQGCRAFFVTKL
jgi:hypothetical protein